MGQSEPVPCANGFAGSSDGMRFAFDGGALGGWKAESIDSRAWERRGGGGLYDEASKTAELMLVSEGPGGPGTDPGGNMLLARVLPLLKTPDGGLSPDANKALAGIRELVQSEVRNLTP